MTLYTLNIGDKSEDGKVEIVDEDRLCYLVKNSVKGAYGLRTISKRLLDEFVEYISKNPQATGDTAKKALSGKSDVDKYEYGYNATLVTLANIALQRKTVKLRQSELPLQQIFYGAPGTGKSHAIKELTAGKDVTRTTFHPDTDYATFVGAYKPTMKFSPICNELGEPVNIGGKPMHKEQITYEFVPQAFLQAYVAAWSKLSKMTDLSDVTQEYLVIEEINRGNCAQIFGDLFQLLDRGDGGFSEYPIKADADMKRYLQGALKDIDLDGIKDALDAMLKGKDVARQVKEGDILLLPCNLCIWATMNTSDQSLFPIDSAFKRRWDWQYVPISDAGKQWVIRVNGNDYDWWDFLEEINKRIYKATYSEDKKLGYFFCKAKDGVIDAEAFVSKVVFYLWNDVFKDMEFEGDPFKDVDNSKLSFDKFYTVEGNKTKVVSDKVELFLQKLGLTPVKDNEEEDDADEDDNTATDAKIQVNGRTIDKVNAIPYSTIEEYVRLNPKKTAQEVADTWRDFKKYSMRSWIIATKEELDDIPERYASYSYQIECGDGESVWVNKDGWMHHPKNTALRDTIKEFIDAVNSSGLGIEITESNE